MFLGRKVIKKISFSTTSVNPFTPFIFYFSSLTSPMPDLLGITHKLNWYKHKTSLAADLFSHYRSEEKNISELDSPDFISTLKLTNL